MSLRRFIPDGFTLGLLGAVVLGALLPAEGNVADVLDVVADIAIGLVFFLHGARLHREVVIAGLRQWRLQGFILATTFVVFPLLGLVIHAALPSSFAAPLATGILFLCLLPSTVQSSIALTSVAGGNVAAAVCAATASNLIGMVLTPAAVSLLLQTQGSGVSLSSFGPILYQLLLPFIAGQLLQPLIGGFVARRRRLLAASDRGAILLVVYLAFSAAVVANLWDRVSVPMLVALVAICIGLFAAVVAFTTTGARLLGFGKADEITAVFCGSLKSLVAGIPIANVLFAGPDLGLIVIPVMLFHQVQLVASSFIARRYALRGIAASP
ncbi:MAG: bile acid:sodium symporter [Bauldia sp.]|nr:bile acid:sodium symporter [Bauldia sp.]